MKKVTPYLLLSTLVCQSLSVGTIVQATSLNKADSELINQEVVEMNDSTTEMVSSHDADTVIENVTENTPEVTPETKPEET
ncbi:hypothetical protein, partial [Vagococcus teuberi]